MFACVSTLPAFERLPLFNPCRSYSPVANPRQPRKQTPAASATTQQRPGCTFEGVSYANTSVMVFEVAIEAVPVLSKKSAYKLGWLGSFSMVQLEHPTQSLPALYSAASVDRGIRTLQQPILQPLVITLFVIMSHVLSERAFER